MKRKIFDINKSSVFHRRLNYDYPFITHGEGIYLYDKSGKRYIDAVGGALVANLGHHIPEIANAIKKLATKTSFLHAAQFTTEHMEEYAKEICSVSPKNLKRVYFVSGGSEAVETAIKLARQYHYNSGDTKKFKIVYTYPSYHGATIGALSVTGKDVFRATQKPYLLHFPSFLGFSSYRCPHNNKKEKCDKECAYELEKVIKKEKANTIAALIIEPIVGASGGAISPPAGYFQVISKICKKYNILLIADEVMTGFGRTGKWFACEHFNLQPNILVTAKGISGGFVPLAAVLCDEKIYKTIKRKSGNFLHGFTFANNAFTTGVGQVVFKYMQKNNLVRRSKEQGAYLLKKLNNFKKFGIVGDVRGRGLMTAIEFVENKESKKPFSRKVQLAEKILQIAQKKGLILYFCVGFVDGVNGDAVMIAPPFSITKKEIDTILNILSDTLIEVEQMIKA